MAKEFNYNFLNPDGTLDVGEGTPFENPFRPFKSFPVSIIPLIDAEDMKRYLIPGKKITYRDSYAFYGKYVFPGLFHTKYRAAILRAKGFNCRCGMGQFCHANLFRILLRQKTHEISKKQSRNRILKSFERR